MNRFVALSAAALIMLAGAAAVVVETQAAETKQDAKPLSIAALYKDKAQLAGKSVRLKGKVVKVNNNIMGRNFLHIQDGTGDKSTNDLTLTSTQTAALGDQITVTGKVVLDKDFGAGYAYPVLLEDASIAK